MSVYPAPEKPDTAAPQTVVIIDYGLGNVRSVANALEAIGANACISNDFETMSRADCLILPGVGAFGDGMNNLRRLGLTDQLPRLVLDQKKPLMGICLGMQLLAKKGFENGEHEGLGWINAEAVRFPADMMAEGSPLKVPHVGWNDVKFVRDSILGVSIDTVQSFYFVHSYHLQCKDPGDAVGICNYGGDFPAMIQKENIVAAQFHPEKSQKHGLELLRRFLLQARQVTHA